MQVKVHNTNIYPYKEQFREREIVIPAGSFVEMDEDEADYFMQTFTFPKKDAQGRPDPLFFKKLKLEKPRVDKPVDSLVCHANGAKAASVDDLNKLVVGFSHMLAEKEDAHSDAELEALKKENAALRREKKEQAAWRKKVEEKLGMSSENVTHEESV